MHATKPYDTKRHRRIAHLAEGMLTPRSAKTTNGVVRYGRHATVALIDSTRAGRTAQDCLGAGGDAPVVASLAEALRHDPDTLLIGITPPGGAIPAEWRAPIIQALGRGIDVINGLHEFLGDDDEFVAAARRGDAAIWDVRRPARDLPVGTGLCRRSRSYISLMVGTDCAIGKMTVALEIERDARRRGIHAEFVATGQTGIMIAGWGSPIDAIPGDFMAGAVERDCLSVDGCDMILVEGQGSLLHPGFSSVTLALLHGSCPHSLVLCHELGRDSVNNISDMPIPPLGEVVRPYVELAAPMRRPELVAVSFNSSKVDEFTARAAIADAERTLGVPATDPVRFGAGPLTEALDAHRRALGLPRRPA